MPLKISEEILEMLENPATFKMIGSVDNVETVNLDPVSTVKVVGDDIIAFACSNEKRKFIIENMKKHTLLSLAVFEPDMIGFQLKGRVSDIEYNGQLLDSFKEFCVESKPFAVVKMMVTEIYALTMAVAGEKVL